MVAQWEGDKYIALRNGAVFGIILWCIIIGVGYLIYRWVT